MRTAHLPDDLKCYLNQSCKKAEEAGIDLPERQEFYQGKVTAYKQILDYLDDWAEDNL